MSDLIQTYLSSPSKPAFKLPANSCDAHCHIFGPASQFPYAESRAFTPVDAGKEKLFALHDVLGIERCVILTSTKANLRERLSVNNILDTREHLAVVW